MKIVFLCTGNTCRSPMAEAIFSDKLKKRKIKGITVDSCGLKAEGQPVSAFAKEVLEKNGVKCSKRKSVQFSQKIMEDADAIICMTPSHVAAANSEKAADFSMLYGLSAISDPFGKDENAYRETFLALNLACEFLIADAAEGTLSQKIKISRTKCGLRG